MKHFDRFHIFERNVSDKQVHKVKYKHFDMKRMKKYVLSKARHQAVYSLSVEDARNFVLNSVHIKVLIITLFTSFSLNLLEVFKEFVFNLALKAIDSLVRY